MKHRKINGLYGITPDGMETAELIAKTEQILAGGAQLIQYRNKNADKDLRTQQAVALLQLCRRYGVPMIVNDHLDLTMEIDAEGIHVGKHDTNVAAARQQLGRDKIIGSSCYNEFELALLAESQGADYAAFGAFYPTSTKQNTVVAPQGILSQAKNSLNVSIICIGGINQTNALPLIKNGADAVAVSNALYQAADIYKTAQSLSQLFE